MHFQKIRLSKGNCSSLMVLATLALVGCSYSYPLDVSFSASKVMFSAKKHSSGCLDYLEVKSDAGELMWRFEGPLRLSDCRSDLPLIYGHVPPGSTSSIPAKRLRTNVRYYVAASDGDSYFGSFRIQRMLAIDSDPEEGRNGPYFKEADSLMEAAGNGS